MASKAGARPPLKLASLDEAVTRLEHLHRGGYRSLGRWNLAQTCEHLSDWMEFMISGYPPAPWPMRVMMWGMRRTLGPAMLRKILATGSMSRGGPTLKQTVHPAAGLEESTSLKRFRETVARFKACEGQYHASPIFGPLSAEDGWQLQLVHCAHHISLLVPLESARPLPAAVPAPLTT